MKLLIWLIYPIIEASLQGYLIQKANWSPNYLQLFIIRGFWAIIFGGVILQLEYGFIQFAIWLTWCTTSFYIVFNPLLNKLRGKPFDYRGKESGWLDKLLKHDLAYWAFYSICVLLAVISLIKGIKIL